MGLSLTDLDWTIGGLALVGNIFLGLWLPADRKSLLVEAASNNDTKCGRKGALLHFPFSGLELPGWKSRDTIDRGFANEVVG